MKELTIEKCNISVCINNKPCNFNFGQTNKSKCKLKQDENVMSQIKHYCKSFSGT